jgi:hypothetical protein
MLLFVRVFLGQFGSPPPRVISNAYLNNCSEAKIIQISITFCLKWLPEQISDCSLIVLQGLKQIEVVK